VVFVLKAAKQIALATKARTTLRRTTSGAGCN
jgi:hypothetical protein